MTQQLLYIVTILGCVLLVFAAAMSWRLFATRRSRPPGGSTLNDTPKVRRMLYTLLVAVGVCAVAAVIGIVLAVIRMF